ncbi:MAG: hypothetical protein V1704_03780 [Candidatus Vogelbacteria bacterium]
MSTGNSAPEEGDFNSTAIRSGTMSVEEWKYLQEDLRSVEGQGEPYEYNDEDD